LGFVASLGTASGQWAKQIANQSHQGVVSVAQLSLSSSAGVHETGWILEPTFGVIYVHHHA
jgi:hypothetical protein